MCHKLYYLKKLIDGTFSNCINIHVELQILVTLYAISKPSFFVRFLRDMTEDLILQRAIMHQSEIHSTHFTVGCVSDFGSKISGQNDRSSGRDVSITSQNYLFRAKTRETSIVCDNTCHSSQPYQRPFFCLELPVRVRCSEVLQTSEDCCLLDAADLRGPSDPARNGRLVLYVFDCCSESHEVATGFRAIITIRKKQGRSAPRS